MSNKFSPLENLLIIGRDKYLVKESLAGNSSAFSTLMFLHKKRVEAIARRFFYDQSDVDDFIQDVFLKAYDNLDSYKGESKFSTWLTRIAFNTGVNLKTRTKTTESLLYEDSESIESPYRTPEENGIREVTKLAVKTAIAELPEKYARCVEMHFFLGMTYEDISETTGIPVNTIKTHIFNAKKMLYEKLKEFKV
ncbi:MAG: RNA polymerase sigma factor [Treponema sp.]|nr:RNA polymerase sigma factor [Candidatus Treponema equi]